MFGLGMPEIIIILVAVGILLFGSKKIVEVARSLGRFSGEFKKGKQEVDKELKEASLDVSQDASSSEQMTSSTQSSTEQK